MTLILIALIIAGHTVQWYWLLGALTIDVVWLIVRLNFLAVLVRRSVEDALNSLREDVDPGA